MLDEDGHAAVLLENAGDLSDAAGTDLVENSDDFLNPLRSESRFEGLINGALAGGWEGDEFLGDLAEIRAGNKIAEADGTGIELEGLAAADDLVAGGDELHGLAELNTRGFLRAIINVREEFHERFGILLEGSHIGGDGFEGFDHALDVFGGFKICK